MSAGWNATQRELEILELRAVNKTLFDEHRIAMSLLRENTATLESVAAERDDLLKANQILQALIGNRDKEVDRLRDAIETFTDVFSEGSEDYPDDECVVVKGGRTSDFTLTIGHFRRAALALSQADRS
jgi:hypothetical protein